MYIIMIIATLYHTIVIACETLRKEMIKKRSDFGNPMQGQSLNLTRAFLCVKNAFKAAAQRNIFILSPLYWLVVG